MQNRLSRWGFFVQGPAQIPTFLWELQQLGQQQLVRKNPTKLVPLLQGWEWRGSQAAAALEEHPRETNTSLSCQCCGLCPHRALPCCHKDFKLSNLNSP